MRGAFVVQDNGAVGREGRTLGDIQAHAVTLSDGSELSYAGSAISGSTQTFVRRTESIPEEPKVQTCVQANILSVHMRAVQTGTPRETACKKCRTGSGPGIELRGLTSWCRRCST